MSAINLLILGSVLNKDWSAYELAQFIETNDIDRLLKVSAPAIYRNLVKLAEQDYLAVRVTKEGEMPEKKIYSLTPSGRDYYYHLLQQVSTQQINYYFDLNTVIANLDNISGEQANTLIGNIREQLQSLAIIYEQAETKHRTYPLVVRALIRQQQMLNQTMLEWLDQFEATFKAAQRS
jgi:DNA-binding PadR family transcriptional regulator